MWRPSNGPPTTPPLARNSSMIEVLKSCLESDMPSRYGARRPTRRWVPSSVMRIFLAGATGVIGRRLLPLLVDAGHHVAGLTRSEARVGDVTAAGAVAVVADVYDADALRDAVVEFEADAVVHELTDLPDDAADLGAYRDRNARIRREGTANLLAAARR